MLEQILLSYCLISTSAIAGRLAGSGAIGNSSFVGGTAFAFPFGLAVCGAHLSAFWGFAAFLWVYGWFQTSHGTAYDMGTDPSEALSGRKAPLSYIIDPLCKAVGRPLGGSFYCWAFMGLKGLLITLPLGLLAVAGAVLYPAGYYAGKVLFPKLGIKFDNEIIAELTASGLLGAILAAYVVTQ